MGALVAVGGEGVAEEEGDEGAERGDAGADDADAGLDCGPDF